MTQLSGKNVALMAVAILVFCVSTIVVCPTDQLVIVLNGVFLGLTISLTVALLPLLWRAVRSMVFDDVSRMTLTIVLTWIALIILRGNNVWGRHYGFENATGANFAIPTSIYLAICGAILQLTIPGFVDLKSRAGRRIAMFNTALGLLVAAGAIAIQVHHRQA